MSKAANALMQDNPKNKKKLTQSDVDALLKRVEFLEKMHKEDRARIKSQKKIYPGIEI